MKFTIRFGDTLYNAALLGFYRVLQDGGLPFKIVDSEGNEDEISGDGIEFDSDILKDFTNFYLKALIHLLGNDSAFKKIEEISRRLAAYNQDDKNSISHLQEDKKYVIYKMTSASYKAAYEIISQKGETYDFENQIIKIKKSEKGELVDLIAETIKKMKEYSDIFMLKDIIYSNIQYFWSDVSFLNRNENKTDYATAYTKSFIRPVEELVSLSEENKKRKTSLECCQCSMSITAGESFSMSWIGNLGVDLKRKTNIYWNFKPDLVLCPICNLVYSCLPLGFMTKGTESYFVNLNSSIKDLLEANNYIENSDEKFGYYQILRKFITYEHKETAENEIDNIQIIRRSGNRLIHNILSRDKLSSIKECEDELSQIIHKNYSVNNMWHNLFDQVINYIFNCSNMYNLINQQFILLLGDDKVVPTKYIGEKCYNFIMALEKIQVKLYGKDKVKMRNELLDKGFKSGHRLRMNMLGADRNENKIKGLSFRLINALKCQNRNQFLDIVMRQYLSEKDNMPKELTYAMEDEEIFLDYGYAFLNGLNSYTILDGDNKEVNTNE